MASREALPVSVDVFVSACGARPDHLAPFAALMKLNKAGPFTMDEWHQRWEAFKHRPIKGKDR